MDLDKEELEYTKIINGSMKPKEIIKLIESLKKENNFLKQKKDIREKIEELEDVLDLCEIDGHIAKYKIYGLEQQIEILKEILGE